MGSATHRKNTMVDVNVTIWIRGKETQASQVADASVKSALTQLSRDMSKKLSPLKCPTHETPVKNARIAIDKSGNGDFRYESCCAELQKLVSKATA
jgi:hypothetical protein